MCAIVRRLPAVHCGVCGPESRVDGRVVEVVVVRLAGSRRRYWRRVASTSSRSVALGNLTGVRRRRWGCGCRDGSLMRCRVGRWLYLRGTWLLLEYGVVAKALALAFLAVAANGMSFVALEGRGKLAIMSRTREVEIEEGDSLDRSLLWWLGYGPLSRARNCTSLLSALEPRAPAHNPMEILFLPLFSACDT